MLAIEVEYLMDRAVAADASDRTLAEWPPHPQRFFSALVAAHEELELGPDSESVLRWLEALPPPRIAADRSASARDVRPHFVPVNDHLLDSKVLDKGGDRLDWLSLRGARARQARFFPAVVPCPSRIVFHWPDVELPPERRDSLTRLLDEVTYLGHSSSPVRASVSDLVPETDWHPDNAGTEELRVPGPGRLDRLRENHELRLKNESVGIPLGRTQRYSGGSRRAQAVFGSARVLAIIRGPQPGMTLGLEGTIPVMSQLRRALLKHLDDSGHIPEVLSGHDDQGRPSRFPHLAIFPLAYVGSEYADGSVKGFGFALPRSVDLETQRRLDQALERLSRLVLGTLGSLELEPARTSGGLAALNVPVRYVGPAQTWSSVTPVVLDRHPKPRLSIQQILANASTRIGLPAPEVLYIGDRATVKAAPPASVYHTNLRRAADAGHDPPSPLRGRPWCHVELLFPEPVCGPLLIGAGRFCGYGLLMPSRRRSA